MIGIREVYSKLGKEGQIEELINTPENASCQCKIIRWYQPNKATEKCYLKNSSLDSINDSTLRNLIDERSILLKDPEEGLILIKK